MFTLGATSSGYAGDAPAASDAASGTVEQVVVTAPRQEVKARAVQKDALTLVQVQPIETILKYPDYNVAEALGRVLGVSLSTDTGEGRFVNIRGIDSNLNGASYGGIHLLNNSIGNTVASGTGRAVEFDAIPTGAVDGFVVYKTLSPDREAEGLGGQIEITPRSAKDLTKPFLDGTLSWGYENLHDHTGPFTADLSAGVRFGFNNGKLIVEGDGQEQPTPTGWISNPTPFSIILTGSRKDDRRGFDDIEVGAYLNDGAQAAHDSIVGEEDFRRYDYHRRRFGYGGEFDFKPNDNHSYYVRANVFGYTEGVKKNHFVALLDGHTSQIGNLVSDTFTPVMQSYNYDQTFRNTVLSVGGSDKFDKLELDYQVGYMRATFLNNHDYASSWTGSDSYFVTYDNLTNPDKPNFRFYSDPAHTQPLNLTNPAIFNSPGNAAINSQYETAVDEEYSYQINARYPVDLLGGKGFVKAGLSARIRDKTDYLFRSSASLTADFSQYVIPGATNGGYYHGIAQNGPIINQYAVASLINANLPPDQPVFKNDFNTKENVYAGYGMYTAEFGKLGVLAGLRVESTDATYGYYVTTTSSAGSSTRFTTQAKNYTNLFPTFQLKYTLQPDLLIRATYSTGIARPGFTQVGGRASVDYTNTPASLSSGNPNLKPTTGNNYDFDVEYYMPNGGIIEVGVFDKEFSNYIVANSQRNAVSPLLVDPVLDPTGVGTITSYANESAYARGIEVGYHQKFTNLPGYFAGLGVESNFTVVDSRYKEVDASVSNTGVSQYGRLPGTSHVTWNLSPFYELHGFEARLSMEYVGHSLFGPNGHDRTLDTIQDKKLNVDFTTSYEFDKHWTAFVNVKNLTDAPLRYYEGVASRPIQREFYGQTYEAGVRAKF